MISPREVRLVPSAGAFPSPPRQVRLRFGRAETLPRRLAALWIWAAAMAAAQAPEVSAPSPVRNYTLSFFSESGYHSMHVRGGTADLRDPERIVVTDLTLTLFTGDASRTVDTVILSPRAILEPEPQQVWGPGPVRLVGQDLELTGEDWRYDHPAKKILIQRRARIVFQAELADLLK